MVRGDVAREMCGCSTEKSDDAAVKVVNGSADLGHRGGLGSWGIAGGIFDGKMGGDGGESGGFRGVVGGGVSECHAGGDGRDEGEIGRRSSRGSTIKLHRA